MLAAEQTLNIIEIFPVEINILGSYELILDTIESNTPAVCGVGGRI